MLIARQFNYVSHATPSHKETTDMELLVQRSQKGGMMGGVKFVLQATVKLSDIESSYVKKYKMSDVLLYEKGSEKIVSASGTMSLIAARLSQLRVTVADLVSGKTIEGKDIIDIMAAEGQIKEAVEMFHKMLTAASGFEGEEVIRYQ